MPNYARVSPEHRLFHSGLEEDQIARLTDLFQHHSEESRLDAIAEERPETGTRSYSRKISWTRIASYERTTPGRVESCG